MHVVGPGYLSHRLSGIATGQCLTLLVRGELRLSSEPYPSRLRAVTTLAGARPDQLVNRPLDHPLEEVEMIERVLDAAREGGIELYTSMLTVAEVLHIGDKPPSPDFRQAAERLLLSGRDGIKTVAPDPPIALLARDLAWQEGLWERSIDRMHVATAVRIGAKELLTIDGRLAKAFKRSDIRGCRLVAARDTQLLPAEYRMDGMFKKAGPP